ncbi:hypothetical protein M426DRAFT_98130 [Hypoxylon sp. CI-4A]|nr:hypothetical protein M426DRAFT_98130 [Hypoxylon sp. CI-4A]
MHPPLLPLIERASPLGAFNGTPPDRLPAENGLHVWRAAVAMPFISFPFVVLRFYTRTYLLKAKTYTVDDYVVALTMLVCIAHSVLMANATYNGMGLHIWQYDSELNSRYYLWVGITSEFYALALCGFKSALLLLYIQLFGVYAKFRWTCYATLFFCVSYLLCNMMTEFFGCQPIRKKWEPSLPGSCIDTDATAIFYGACSMASDLIIAILPLTMIWKLQVATLRQKIGLSLVLSSGFFAWAVAVARWGIATFNLVGTSDRPWWAGISFTLSILEIHTGLICACVATLSPLWKIAYSHVRDWTGWSTHRSTKVTTWPSFVRKPTDIHTHNNTRRPSHASIPWGRRNGGLDNYNGPAGRANNISSDLDTTLNASREDEYGLLDISEWRSHATKEDRSQNMEDV